MSNAIMKTIFMLGVIFTILILSGCSDAERASFSALGSKHSIKCYSGTVLIYEGESTGAISNEAHSDGYYFKDQKTDKLTMVSGNCVIVTE